MNRRKARILPLLLLGLAALPEQGRGAEKVFPLPIRRTTLANGLSVLSIPFDSPGIFAY
jgi:zinc protease